MLVKVQRSRSEGKMPYGGVRWLNVDEVFSAGGCEARHHAPLGSSVHRNGDAVLARAPSPARPVNKGLGIVGQLVMNNLAGSRTVSTKKQTVGRVPPSQATTGLLSEVQRLQRVEIYKLPAAFALWG